MKRITINPITRLEGHGKIEICLDDQGDVQRAFFQVPELAGFEKFAEGRPAEEMARITPRICGVCPTAHHMASVKTLDKVFNADPPPAARKIRELMYSAFMVEDHAIHFYFLGGPDFVVGPTAPKGERNILGVINKVGLDAAGKVLKARRECRSIVEAIGGKVIHPVGCVPGGVSQPLTAELVEAWKPIAANAVEFAQFSLQVFDDIVLKNPGYVQYITGDIYRHQTYYMGLVDRKNKVNFYDGEMRVVTPQGKEFARFAPADYLQHISEHVESWSYIKFPFLKKVGWQGFVDGEQSGVYRVAPLARLNAADGMATPLAQKEYERLYATLEGKPAHHTLAFHWARLVEMLYAAERLQELVHDPEILSPVVRTLPSGTPGEGVGIVEAPRGTLIHHYAADPQGMIRKANLIVATIGNSAAICMSIEKAAKALIKKGKVDDGLLNMVEMAFRAYDPCLACATHSLPGQMPLEIVIRNAAGEPVRTLRR